MKTSRVSDSQIMAILKQAEAGITAPELCREHGIMFGYVLQVEHQVRRYGRIVAVSAA